LIVLDAVAVDNMPRGMRYTIIFGPSHVKNLVREGHTKEKIKKYITGNKLVPKAQIRTQADMEASPGVHSTPLPSGDMEMVPPIKDYRFVRVIVGGDPGAFIAYLVGGSATPGKKEIQKIELPKNWDRLVAKYKNIFPTYVKY
jgi:hypothetical protein